MKDIINKIDSFLINEKMWSSKVKTKWEPPKDLFTKSSNKIASALISASSDLKQAMSRVNFYVNRAGENLTDKDIKKFNKVKEILRKHYE